MGRVGRAWTQLFSQTFAMRCAGGAGRQQAGLIRRQALLARLRRRTRIHIYITRTKCILKIRIYIYILKNQLPSFAFVRTRTRCAIGARHHSARAHQPSSPVLGLTIHQLPSSSIILVVSMSLYTTHPPDGLLLLCTRLVWARHATSSFCVVKSPWRRAPRLLREVIAPVCRDWPRRRRK